MSGKLRPSELVVACGTGLLFLSTFLTWFSLPSAAQLSRLAPSARLVGGGSDTAINLNVWDLGFVRWWVYLSVLLGACMVLAALLSRTPNWATVLATPLVVCSLIASVGLLGRLFDAPRPYASGAIGFYLALVGALTLLTGVCWALRDEAVPEGFEKAPRPEFIDVD